MSADKNQSNNYFYCPACQGRGEIGSRPCSSCQGRGLGLWLDNIFVWWDYPLSADFLWEKNCRRLIGKMINFLLWLGGWLGLFSLAAYLLGQYDGLNLKLFFSQRQWQIFFTLSLLTDLYLFYRLSRENNRVVPVQEKTRRLLEPFLILDFASFGDLPSLAKDRRAEASAAFDNQAIEMIGRAYFLSRRLRQEFGPWYLAVALLAARKTRVLLSRLSIDSKFLVKRLSQAVAQAGHGPAPDNQLLLKKIFLTAYQNAYLARKRQVDVLDLFVAMAELHQPFNDLMYDFGADLGKIKNVAVWLSFSRILSDNQKRFRLAARYKPGGDIDRAMTALATPFLNHHSHNLTLLAKLGHFGPFIGREKEVEEIFQIMESGGTPHVILVGDEGVGKTALLEGLAQLMVLEEVPEVLQDKRLMSLSVASLIGGAAPEEAQARLMQALGEVTQAGNIVLAIENIKDLIGITVGGQESLDLSGVLSQALANKNFFCLATASRADYRRYIEGQSSLSSVFHKVEVPEVGRNEAIQILEAQAAFIEYRHRVYFSYDAIARAVDLSERFIHDRNLPAKALTILEEAAVLTRRQRGVGRLVSGEDVAVVVSTKAKVPASQVTAEEGDKLLHLEEKIHERIVGQDEAVKMVATALRRARAELRSEKRPIANLLFLGPTGVGKTELAKTVAAVYFGDEKNMIRLDMSEYQGSDGILRLIGGQNERGLLTEAARQKPFSLILLDEIEKADANVLNLFLQVMDDGRLTDGLDQTIDFTNTIIIATSNAGTDFIQEQVKAGVAVKQIKEQLMDQKLKIYFKPEFLNRFDGLIVFRPLNLSEVKSIAKLLIKEVAADLERRGVALEVTPAAIDELAQAGFDPGLGARPLRRVIQEKVSDTLANYVLANKLDRRDTVIFDQDCQVTVKKAKNLATSN